MCSSGKNTRIRVQSGWTNLSIRYMFFVYSMFLHAYNAEVGSLEYSARHDTISWAFRDPPSLTRTCLDMPCAPPLTMKHQLPLHVFQKLANVCPQPRASSPRPGGTLTPNRTVWVPRGHEQSPKSKMLANLAPFYLMYTTGASMQRTKYGQSLC